MRNTCSLRLCYVHQADPTNKRLGSIPEPLTKEDILVKELTVGANMFENYLMFTDWEELPAEARKAYGKMDRLQLPEPILAPRPTYMGKLDTDALTDWIVDKWNKGELPKDWVTPKAKGFQGPAWPPLSAHLKNLDAARGMLPSLPTASRVSNACMMHACMQCDSCIVR